MRREPGRFLFAGILGLGAIYAAILVVVMACRLRWPYEIEWMEGGELMHAVQLRLGRSLYGPPRADFVPFFYTPLYPAALAACSWLGLPLGFALGRAVSGLSTLAIMAMLYAVGAREAGRACGLLAAFTYAALFRFCGAWFDLVRADSLALALVLGSVVTARRATRPPGAMLCAALLVAAFFTKQTALVFAIPLALCLLARDRKLGFVFIAAAVALGGLATWACNVATDGWFWFYVFEGHQGHRFLWDNFRLEYWRDVLFLAPALWLFPLLALSYGRRTRWLAVVLGAWLVVAFVQRAATLDYPEHMYYRELWYESPRGLLLVPPLVMAALLGAARALARRASPIAPFWLAMAGAGALSSALNHSTQWSYSNCFMPVALFGSLAVAFATRAFAETGSAGVLAIVALGVQFCALAYNPAAQVPSRADWAALDLLDRRIDGMERPLLMPSHPFLTYQKTGQVHLHQMSIGDVAFRSGVPDLEPRIARGDWRTAVVDDATGIAALDGPMILSDRLTYRAAELYPKTGFRVRPSAVWRWSEAVERELAPRVTGNFESGSYTGWTATGGFGAAPSLRTDLPELKGIQGERAASSRNGAGPGVLESAPFVLVAPRVTMLVAGTLGAYVRALRGAEEIGRVQPADTHVMTARSLELDAHVGERITLEVVDEEATEEGRARVGIVVDDLRAVW